MDQDDKELNKQQIEAIIFNKLFLDNRFPRYKWLSFCYPVHKLLLNLQP